MATPCFETAYFYGMHEAIPSLFYPMYSASIPARRDRKMPSNVNEYLYLDHEVYFTQLEQLLQATD